MISRHSGFKTGKSTENAIVEMGLAVDTSEHRYVVTLLFDTSRAFDNVWSPLVLKRFRDRECVRNVFEVITSYFSERRVALDIDYSKVFNRAARSCRKSQFLVPPARI